MKKQEKIQERSLRFLLNDYESNYEQLLLAADKTILVIRKLKILATEIFKTINDLNPSFMKEIFELNTRRDNQSSNLIVQSQSSKKYGTDTLRSLGPKIWNSLPNDIRSSNSLYSFKKLIKAWSGPQCKCNKCKCF